MTIDTRSESIAAELDRGRDALRAAHNLLDDAEGALEAVSDAARLATQLETTLRSIVGPR